MENLDVAGLAKHLKGHLSDDLIETLTKCRINGPRFMGLKESSLKLFQFELADIIDITTLIDDIKSGKTILTSAIESETSRDSHLINEDDKIKSTGPKDTAGFRPDSSSGSSSEEEEQHDPKGLAILKTHVHDAYLKSLSPYDIKGLVGKCLSWNRMIVGGLSAGSAPNLPVPPRYLLKLTQGEGSGVKVTKFSDSAPKSSSRRTDKDSNKVESTRQSGRLAQDVNRRKRKGGTLNESSDMTETEGNNTSFTPEDEGSSSEPQIPSKLYKRNQDYTFSDSDEGDDDDNKENEPQVKYKLPSPPSKQKDDLSKISPQLPTIEIEIILNTYDETKVYVDDLKEGYLFVEKIRKLIIRTIVKHVCFQQYKHPRHVNKLIKEGIAKSFVVTYPQFQKLVEVDGKDPWSHITANVMNVMKRIMTALPDEERPRKSKALKKKKKFKLSKNVNPKVLAVMDPRSEREDIFHGMKETFPNREKDRQLGNSITQIVQDWPHLTSFDGEMISVEFSLMKPDAKDMVVQLTRLIPQILSKWEDDRVKPICKDDTMRALLILAARLPHKISKNSTAVPVEKEILELIKVGTSVEEYALAKCKASKVPIQPYLIGYRSALNQDVLKYFLVLDKKPMDLGQVPLLRAIDLLFKCYCVFNVNYPKTWSMFFRFIQTCFFKVFFGANDDIPPSCQHVYAEMLSW